MARLGHARPNRPQVLSGWADFTVAGSEVTADPATIVFSGVDATLAGTGATTVAADTATLTFVGVDAVLSGSGPVSIVADVATFTFSGVDATLNPGPVSITADAATLTFSGVDATLAGTGAGSVTADPATLTLSGVDATLAGTGAASVTADPATLVFSGVDASLTAGADVTPARPVVRSQAVGRSIDARRRQATAQFVDLGAPLLAGGPIDVTADPATIVFSGVDAILAGTGIASITADLATIAFTGVDAILAGSGPVSIQADPATLVFSGVDATLTTVDGNITTNAPLVLSFAGSTQTDHLVGVDSPLDLVFSATLGADRSVTIQAGIDFMVSVTFSGMLTQEEGMKYGPCEPWDVTWCCPPSVGPDLQNLAAEAATEVLWAMSGRQFGFCDGWLRPCRRACVNGSLVTGPWWDYDGGSDWIRPALLDGAWTNVVCGVCTGDCSCSSTEEVALPGRVNSVISVQIDGTSLPATGAYRLDDHRLLVRTDGGKWPLCQDWNASSGPGTWFVQTRWGLEPPSMALLAVSELANEFINACVPGAECKLPQRVTSIDRNGVTIALDDIQALLRDGQLGLTLCDYFIATVNPNRLAQHSGVYSPDITLPRIQSAAPA